MENTGKGKFDARYGVENSQHYRECYWNDCENSRYAAKD